MTSLATSSLSRGRAHGLTAMRAAFIQPHMVRPDALHTALMLLSKEWDAAVKYGAGLVEIRKEKLEKYRCSSTTAAAMRSQL